MPSPQKVSKNFYDHEFLPPEVFNSSRLQNRWFIRPEVVALAQLVRDHFGKPCTVNNWYGGGRFKESGYRTPKSKTGADHSQHRLANAIDIKLSGVSADEARAEILKNEQKFMNAGLTTLESGKFAPTWVHMDLRDTGMSNILIVGA